MNDQRQKERARRTLKRAVRDGLVIKPDTCSDCGETFEPKDVDGHHYAGYDDEHALDVVWLCKRCHGLLHGGALLITDEQRRAGVRTRLREQTPEQRDRYREWGRELGQRYGLNSITQFNTQSTPDERVALARKANAASTVCEVIVCDICSNRVTKLWLRRHKESNCVRDIRRRD